MGKAKTSSVMSPEHLAKLKAGRKAALERRKAEALAKTARDELRQAEPPRPREAPRRPETRPVDLAIVKLQPYPKRIDPRAAMESAGVDRATIDGSDELRYQLGKGPDAGDAAALGMAGMGALEVEVLTGVIGTVASWIPFASKLTPKEAEGWQRALEMARAKWGWELPAGVAVAFMATWSFGGRLVNWYRSRGGKRKPGSSSSTREVRAPGGEEWPARSTAGNGSAQSPHVPA